MNKEPCYICGEQKETRPYGVNCQLICFGCMQSSQELEAEAKRNFVAQLDAIDGDVLLDGSGVGPRPFDTQRLH